VRGHSVGHGGRLAARGGGPRRCDARGRVGGGSPRLGDGRRRPAPLRSSRRGKNSAPASARRRLLTKEAARGLAGSVSLRHSRAAARRCLRRRSSSGAVVARCGAKARDTRWSGSAKRQKGSSLRRRAAAGIRATTRCTWAHVGGDSGLVGTGAWRRRARRSVSAPRERALALAD
jgi:hypothetical protein